MLGARAPVPRLKGAASEAGSRRLNNAVAERGGARTRAPVAGGAALKAKGTVPWLRGAALEAQPPVAGIALDTF